MENNSDFKIFLKYIYQRDINSKRWLTNPTFYKWILFFFLSYIVLFTKLSLELKLIFILIYLFLNPALDYFALYKSGIHRGWWRKKDER